MMKNFLMKMKLNYVMVVVAVEKPSLRVECVQCIRRLKVRLIAVVVGITY